MANVHPAFKIVTQPSQLSLTATTNLHVLSRDGTVVEHLPPMQASHQCGPGSIPGLGAICGLSLLLVLVLAPKGFSPGYSGFPLSSKTNISKFQFDLESEGHKFISLGLLRATLVKQRLFIYFIYLFSPPI